MHFLQIFLDKNHTENKPMSTEKLQYIEKFSINLKYNYLLISSIYIIVMSITFYCVCGTHVQLVTSSLKCTFAHIIILNWPQSHILWKAISSPI